MYKVTWVTPNDGAIRQEFFRLRAAAMYRVEFWVDLGFDVSISWSANYGRK